MSSRSQGRKVAPAQGQGPVFYLLARIPGENTNTLLVDSDGGLHTRYGPATLGCAALGARTATAIVNTCPVIYHPHTRELEGFGGLSELNPDYGSVTQSLPVYGAGYARRSVLPILSLPYMSDGNWNFFVVSNRRKVFVDSDNELAGNVSTPGILGAAGLFAGAVRYVDKGIPVPVRYVDWPESQPTELEAIGDFSEPPGKLDPNAVRGRFRIAAVGFT